MLVLSAHWLSHQAGITLDLQSAMKQNSSSKFEQISRYLISRHETIAVAESVTAGNIQAMLSALPNAASFFQGGITTYNLGQKCKHLQIDPIYGDSCNCVSEKIAVQMATNVAALFNSQWGIAVVGYASPVPELKIRKLFAFYALVYQLKPIEVARLPCNLSGTIKVQQLYAKKIMERLLAVTNGHDTE